MNVLSNKSELFDELFARSDLIDELLKKYKTIECNYELVDNENDITISNYDGQLFMEQYIGMNYDNLSEEQAKLFWNLFESKYKELPSGMQKSQIPISVYTAMNESIGEVPNEAMPKYIKSKICSNKILNFFSRAVTNICSACKIEYVNEIKTIEGHDINVIRHLSDMSQKDISLFNEAIQKKAESYGGWTIERDSSACYNCHDSVNSFSQI